LNLILLKKLYQRYGKTKKEREKYYKLLDLVSYPH